MVKCPFCQYDNEDGALFCEQCKSDLGVVEAVPLAEPAEPAAAAPPAAEAVPLAMPVNQAALPEFAAAQPPTQPDGVEATIPMAAAVEEIDTPPPAPAVEALPQAMPVEAPPEADRLPAGTHPKLVVQRGLKIGVEYPLYDGVNFIGRADEKPVDIDLVDQESEDRVWSSRQHALITFEDGRLVIEDLNSANGTFVNRTRVYPGQKRGLQLNDVIQIGTVQMRVKG